MTRSPLVALLVLLLVGACHAAPRSATQVPSAAASARDTFELVGTVRDEATGRPLAGVLIVVDSLSALRTGSGADGTYRIPAILRGSPALVVGTYVAVAGCLSRLTLGAIVAGHFPRDTGHSAYGRRRLYALCWTAVYYFPPIYHAVLAVPWFKRFTFRIFGYHGSTDFTTYPDTWLRDLPLLNIGDGCYLSNKATISPNMCLKNGKILIAQVNFGAYSMIGHGTLIAPGVTVGAHSEVGVAGTVGVGTSIGEHTRVSHAVAIDHGVIIGSHCDIGSRAYIGRQTVVHDGLRVPAGAIIPAKQVLRYAGGNQRHSSVEQFRRAHLRCARCTETGA